MNIQKLKALIETFRPSFLVLTPICIFLGVSTAFTAKIPIDLLLLSLVLIAAIAAHISVNTLNEYYDFKNGLDLNTTKTAFSGGSGSLPENPELAKTVLMMGLTALLLTILIGIYFILQRGSQIIPIGIVGVLIIATYTQWLNRSPLICLIAPGLGFGPLMIVGTHIILTGSYSPLAGLVSLIPFFLLNNLLLLNQYPDIKADASVGRKTFPIAFGLKISNLVYALFMLSAFALILIFILKGYLPLLSSIACIPMIFSLFALSGAIKHMDNIGAYPQYLAANVAAALLTPLLLGISIMAS